MTSEIRKVRSLEGFGMESATMLKKLVELLGTQAEAAKAIGCSSTIYGTFIKRNKVPLRYALAAECIIRRNGGSRLPKTEAYLVLVPSENRAVVGSILESLNCKLVRLELQSTGN